MANIKEVQMAAWLPYDWTSNLTDLEARVFMAWVYTPITGLEIAYGAERYIEIENGGRLSMHYATLHGQEAIREGALAIMHDAWARQRHVIVEEAIYRDLEYDPNDTSWYTIPTVEQNKAAEQRAKEQVEEMMKGKRWETVDLGNGITQSTLVDDDPAVA